MNADLSSDVQRLTALLGGLVQLASMVPLGNGVGTPRFITVKAGDPQADAFVDRNDLEGRSTYYSLNQTRSGLATKASKSDIVAARGCHVDIDPPKGGADLDKAPILHRLKSLSVPPTYIVDSGNGLQPVWLFDAPTTDFELVEGINRALIQEFGGDAGTFNIDRLLRVPGSLNTPNAKKAAAGRTPVRACFVS